MSFGFCCFCLRVCVFVCVLRACVRVYVCVSACARARGACACSPAHAPGLSTTICELFRNGSICRNNFSCDSACVTTTMVSAPSSALPMSVVTRSSVASPVRGTARRPRSFSRARVYVCVCVCVWVCCGHVDARVHRYASARARVCVYTCVHMCVRVCVQWSTVPARTVFTRVRASPDRLRKAIAKPNLYHYIRLHTPILRAATHARERTGRQLGHSAVLRDASASGAAARQRLANG